MIPLTRLNGERFALNCDLIERIDATPDTVLTLAAGTKYVVRESLDEVIAAVQAFRGGVIAVASTVSVGEGPARLRVVTPAEDA